MEVDIFRSRRQLWERVAVRTQSSDRDPCTRPHVGRPKLQRHRIIVDPQDNLDDPPTRVGRVGCSWTDIGGGTTRETQTPLPLPAASEGGEPGSQVGRNIMSFNYW